LSSRLVFSVFIGILLPVQAYNERYFWLADEYS
jgi:hypothetical protein